MKAAKPDPMRLVIKKAFYAGFYAGRKGCAEEAWEKSQTKQNYDKSTKKRKLWRAGPALPAPSSGTASANGED